MSVFSKLKGTAKCAIGVTHAGLFVAAKTITAPYTILARGEGELFNTKDNIDTIKYWFKDGIKDIKEK